MRKSHVCAAVVMALCLAFVAGTAYGKGVVIENGKGKVPVGLDRV